VAKLECLEIITTNINYDEIKGRLNSQTCKEFLNENAGGGGDRMLGDVVVDTRIVLRIS
jgi:hypothetical protein